VQFAPLLTIGLPFLIASIDERLDDCSARKLGNAHALGFGRIASCFPHAQRNARHDPTGIADTSVVNRIAVKHGDLASLHDDSPISPTFGMHLLSAFSISIGSFNLFFQRLNSESIKVAQDTRILAIARQICLKRIEIA